MPRYCARRRLSGGIDKTKIIDLRSASRRMPPHSRQDQAFDYENLVQQRRQKHSAMAEWNLASERDSMTG
jgi:hypothetical protein